MRKEKALVALMRKVIDVVSSEAAVNPAFAEKLESLYPKAAEHKTREAKMDRKPPIKLPDIYSEWRDRDEMEFRLWLRGQSIPILRGVIRAQDLDSTHRTAKWRDSEKLADFITDSLRARSSRGSAFIGRRTREEHDSL